MNSDNTIKWYYLLTDNLKKKYDALKPLEFQKGKRKKKYFKTIYGELNGQNLEIIKVCYIYIHIYILYICVYVFIFCGLERNFSEIFG